MNNMNMVLFTRDEINRPLPFSDERAEHIINILKFKPGDYFDAGVVNTGTGRALIEKIENSNIYYSFSFTDYRMARNPVSLITAVTRPSEAKKILKNSATIGITNLYLAVFDKTEKSYMDSSLWKNENYLPYFIQGHHRHLRLIYLI
jgi:16S rRNA (uracil1498-N3)-methyltransferase